MSFLSTSARFHLCTLARSADRLPILLPHSRRCITTGRPRAPTFFAPPPGRRRFEPAPSVPDDANNNGNGDALSQLTRRPTNRQIPFSHVYVLDPDTNTVSSTKHSLEALLATHARSAPTPQGRGQGQGQGREWQQQQQQQPRERRVVELVTSSPRPIVRITTRSEAEARYKALKRALKNGAVGETPKEVQLTWGVAWADVEHKLRKAKRDLDKGYRVVVTIAMKRGHRPSSQQELFAFADEITAELDGVGEEHKEREVTGRSMVLSFRKADIP